jgi:hypothetical protein
MIFVLLAVALSVSSALSAESDLPGSCPVDRETWSKKGFQTVRQRAVAQEIRGIAGAIECFGIEHGRYPSSASKVVPFETAIPELVPRYRSYLPATDAWGTALLYWSDGTHYLLVSLSAGAQRDRDYQHVLAEGWEKAKANLCLGPTDEPEADLVFTDGQFCRWLAQE